MVDTPAGQPFQVIVYGNFHYMDESEAHVHGTFATYQSALETAQRLVREDLESQFQPGMDSGKLFEIYQTFGVDPIVSPSYEPSSFSAWDYAAMYCKVLCGEDAHPKGIG